MTEKDSDHMICTCPPAVQAELLSLRPQACFFTGHRNLPRGAVTLLSELLQKEIETLVYQGFSVFYSGAARGFDLLAASMVLRIRRDHPHLRLILAVPCPGQASGWRAADRQLYEAICARGEVYYISDAYDRDCMRRRNYFLVDHAAVGVSYHLEERIRSGTMQTVRYAEKQQVPVINLASFL